MLLLQFINISYKINILQKIYYKIFTEIATVLTQNFSTELTIGSSLELTITGYAHDGRGVARFGGRVIFVDGALCGELVQAEITGYRKKIYYAKLQRVIKAAVGRVEPLCPAFGGCGGCQMQHMTYDEELSFKQGQVQAALSRIGGLGADLPLRPILGANELYHYRNKAVYHVAHTADGAALCFWDEGTHRPAACCCSLLFADDMAAVAEWLQGAGIPPNVSDVMLRRSDSSGEMMLAFKLADENRRAVLPLLKRVQQAYPAVKVLATQTPAGWQVHSLGEYITDALAGTQYQISPPAFFQVNNRQTQKLLAVVAGLLGDDCRVLIDAYCGIGTIGLYMAAKMPQLKRLVGIEVNESAVLNARANAQLNGITNAEFYCGKAEKLFAAVLPAQMPDAVIVDPPRSGCHTGLLGGLLDLQAPQIVYVSCNPATLARDLAVLTAGDYRVAAVQPVDMFPRTHHCECVVKLTKTGV